MDPRAIRTLRALILFCPLLVPAAVPAAQEPEHPLYKTSYRVINVHAHFGAPNEEALNAELEVMDRTGIAAEINLDAGRSDGNLPAWVELTKKHPGRVLQFAKFTKTDFARVKEPGFFDELVRELELAVKMGVRGVKIWKDLGMYIRDGSGALLKIDDPRLDPFWSKCGDLGLPILIHTAD